MNGWSQKGRTINKRRIRSNNWFLREDRTAEIECLHPLDNAQVQHFDDFCNRRAMPQCGFDVTAHAGCIRRADQFDGLARENAEVHGFGGHIHARLGPLLIPIAQLA
jgi:hypothetical protein